MNHEKTKRILKIIGPIILIIGISLALIAIVPFVFMQETDTFGLAFIAFPLIFIGSSLTAIGFHREIVKYGIDENKDNAKYMANYMMDGTRENVVRSANAIRDGYIKKSFCPYCGCENDSDASFCKECGKSLKKICPKCGEENDSNAKYCDNCGTKLD